MRDGTGATAAGNVLNTRAQHGYVYDFGSESQIVQQSRYSLHGMMLNQDGQRRSTHS